MHKLWAWLRASGRMPWYRFVEALRIERFGPPSAPGAARCVAPRLWRRALASNRWLVTRRPTVPVISHPRERPRLAVTASTATTLRVNGRVAIPPRDRSPKYRRYSICRLTIGRRHQLSVVNDAHEDAGRNQTAVDMAMVSLDDLATRMGYRPGAWGEEVEC